MVDPWSYSLAMLLGALVVPPVEWPRSKTRLVVDASRFAPGTARRGGRRERVSDEALLAAIGAAGRSAPDLAAAIGLHRESARRRLAQLADAGRVRNTGGVWVAA